MRNGMRYTFNFLNLDVEFEVLSKNNTMAIFRSNGKQWVEVLETKLSKKSRLDSFFFTSDSIGQLPNIVFRQLSLKRKLVLIKRKDEYVTCFLVTWRIPFTFSVSWPMSVRKSLVDSFIGELRERNS